MRKTSPTCLLLAPEDERLKALELIDLYLQGEALAEAEALINAGLGKFPNAPSFRLRRVRLLLESGKVSEARQSLQHLVSLPEPPAEALWLSARLLILEGNVEEAIADYQRFLMLTPSPPAIFFKELATAYAMGGDSQSSLEFFQRAIATDPSLAEAYADLGLVLESMGRIAEAESLHDEPYAQPNQIFRNLGEG